MHSLTNFNKKLPPRNHETVDPQAQVHIRLRGEWSKALKKVIADRAVTFITLSLHGGQSASLLPSLPAICTSHCIIHVLLTLSIFAEAMIVSDPPLSYRDELLPSYQLLLKIMVSFSSQFSNFFGAV